MWRIGPEIIVVLVIVLILFGPGRITKLAGELGSSIRSFRDNVKNKEQEETSEENGE